MVQKRAAFEDLQQHADFIGRHIGPAEPEKKAMLAALGFDSMDAFIKKVVPAAILTNEDLKLGTARSEPEVLDELHKIASKNQVFKSYIGMGYYNTHTPTVILRNLLENPAWYTAYTPYQPEISQGRLEALLNFQTMVSDLTGMEIANASLLDEATAAAEAMTMLYRVQTKQPGADEGAPQFFVANTCFPQTIDVLRTRAEPMGFEIVVGDPSTAQFGPRMFGALVQTPDEAGVVHELSSFIARAHEAGVLVAVATDLL